ncbi:ribose-5-phosphate isomerase RpiA [Pseudalkalibacillus hwajinpoensis]|uniref:Ribose-5-phosphate isomerase A n=1 Tax=Guptibacillus hwajinpoensis TaxID=208199 RepID=A0A4U1MNH5_9BACL|nr:ribose-5-phosphate isomerase RpiA [Pseudalkalibacillus hwajinpoensis]TKD72020.1 ribose-5-phosphate isomerase RpiA [Pseudalkalibacillus hwajinpoensis]
MNEKQLAGEKAASYIQDGMVVGLGTGSTVYWTILKIAEMVQNGLSIKGVPTSKETEKLAQEHGISLIPLEEVTSIDLTIDGADELNDELTLIKGGGGALLREKIIAYHSTHMIVVADSSKVVSELGRFPLPVEVVPFSHQKTLEVLREMGCQPLLRKQNNSVYLTDNGNYIVDCAFESIPYPSTLHDRINQIPGVVDNGLFIGYAEKAIIGKGSTITYLEK